MRIGRDESKQQIRYCGAGHGEGSMACVWAWHSLCFASVDVLTGCAHLLVLFCIEVLV
jgi:hypothetical protein